MAHNICVIDDKIPIDPNGPIQDTKRIDSSGLRAVLNNDWGVEDKLKSLIIRLIEGPENWNVSGFTHPRIYLNTVDEEYYRPDIVVYDWDFLKAEQDSEDYLLEVLERSFCVISIYSGADKGEEIKGVLSSKRFASYEKRLFFTDKHNKDSDQELLKKAQEMFDGNFAFRFGGELRRTTMDALEHILIELGKVSIDEALEFLSDQEFDEVDLKEMIVEKLKNHSTEDSELIQLLEKEGFYSGSIYSFIHFLGEKLKTLINSTKLGISYAGKQSSSYDAREMAKKLWAYRLYYSPEDDLVRRGDIVMNAEDNRDNLETLFVVISADCDLRRFWDKNFGFINLLPIHRIGVEPNYVVDQLILTRAKSKIIKEVDVTSFANRALKVSDDILILPFIKTENGMNNYMVFPKEITNQKIVMPDEIAKQQDTKKKRNAPLKYSYWPNVKRKLCISEPFLTPFIEHAFTAISGYGTPNYSSIVTEQINESIREILK